MRIFLIALVVATFGINQQTAAQEVIFGVKGGLNISNLYGGEGARNNLMGLHAGLVSDIQLSEKFSLQPELLYTQQGAEATEFVKAKIKLDYIAMPIMAKYYIAKGFSVEAGPQVAFLVNDKAEISNSDIEAQETDAANFDFGANLGLGYYFDSGLFAQTRYNFGITTVGENPDVKNGVFQISLGYRF